MSANTTKVSNSKRDTAKKTPWLSVGLLGAWVLASMLVVVIDAIRTEEPVAAQAPVISEPAKPQETEIASITAGKPSMNAAADSGPDAKASKETAEVIQSFRRRLGDQDRITWSAAKGLNVAKLKETFETLNYDWDRLLAENSEVPRLRLVSVPEDLAEVRHVPEKKAIFFKTMLPLILEVNEEIAADRKRLSALHRDKLRGETWSPTDRAWLVVLSDAYGVAALDTEELLKRVDAIPVSLALAQAAEESGWGTSRFAREGNALFGQWTFKASDPGLAPKKRAEGKTHRVKSFESLIASVRAYAKNLNTHKAYRDLRERRSQQRQRGVTLDGSALAGALKAYSERGEDYVKGLRAIIRVNRLSTLDGARLRDGQPIVLPSA